MQHYKINFSFHVQLETRIIKIIREYIANEEEVYKNYFRAELMTVTITNFLIR